MHKNSTACTTRIDYLLGNSEEPPRMASSRAFRSGVNEDSIGLGDTGDLLECNATESLASVPPLGATPPPSRASKWRRSLSTLPERTPVGDMPYKSATRAQSLPAQLEITVRGGLDPAEAYSVVHGLFSQTVMRPERGKLTGR